MPILLLVLLGLAVGLGSAIVILIMRASRKRSLRFTRRSRTASHGPVLGDHGLSLFSRPTCWVSIRSKQLQAVQAAFGLHNPKPCSWLNGLAGEERIFIAPPVKGWIIVVGSGLPDPTDDADGAFRFVLALSRKFGDVQCFSANRALQHHAWVRAENGRIVRAYSWAGRTLWKQGRRTPAEKDLDVICFDYFQNDSESLIGAYDLPGSNVDKVPALAARWSLDPGMIEEQVLVEANGVSGEPSRRY